MGTHEAIGTVLSDRYLLEALIGSGAMGRVYRAKHVKISRRFAVKVLHAPLVANATAIKRFAQEAELAGSLAHPNVVGVLDAGESALGHYLVMELADGEPLSAMLQGSALPRALIIALLSQLCDGLQHAHAKGAIHRDLKPDNILVSADGTARIVDFGIATLNDAYLDDEPRERLTTEGVALGTPQYMCPCIATGRPYDHRVDLFALGVIAYEMLTGELPFAGDGAEVVRANVSHATPRMANVDPLLAALTHTLMAKDPRDRPRSAHAARALLTMIEHEPALAARVLGIDDDAPAVLRHETTERVALPGGRARWLAPLAFLAGTLALGVGAYVGPLASPSQAVAVVPPPVPVPPPPPAPPAKVVVVEIPAPPSPPAARRRPRAQSGSAGVAPAPQIAVSPGQVVELYAAVGQRLSAHPDDKLWSRFRRIRLYTSIASEEREMTRFSRCVRSIAQSAHRSGGARRPRARSLHYSAPWRAGPGCSSGSMPRRDRSTPRPTSAGSG